MALDNSNNIKLRNLTPKVVGQTKLDGTKKTTPTVKSEVALPTDQGIDLSGIKPSPKSVSSRLLEAQASWNFGDFGDNGSAKAAWSYVYSHFFS